MPWCETCSRFLNPNSLEADGSCPTCGRVAADPGKLAADRAKAADGEVDEKTPWHFKLLIAVVVLYLGWRLVQVIGWIITVQPPLH